jgi:hypothetical protein
MHQLRVLQLACFLSTCLFAGGKTADGFITVSDFRRQDYHNRKGAAKNPSRTKPRIPKMRHIPADDIIARLERKRQSEFLEGSVCLLRRH